MGWDGIVERGGGKSVVFGEVTREGWMEGWKEKDRVEGERSGVEWSGRDRATTLEYLQGIDYSKA